MTGLRNPHEASLEQLSQAGIVLKQSRHSFLSLQKSIDPAADFRLLGRRLCLHDVTSAAVLVLRTAVAQGGETPR